MLRGRPGLFSLPFVSYNCPMAREIRSDALKQYFRQRLGECRLLSLTELGRGAHGTGYLVELKSEGQRKRFVLKRVAAEGLGHDYPSDRAAMHLLALNTFGQLKHHVKALDVLSLQADGALRPVGGGTEYYLLMEEARGVTYFRDLEALSGKNALDESDRRNITAMTSYLAEIHAEKKDSRQLYLRKLRDIIGHGECLMGVFDFYPEGVLTYEEMAEIEKRCLDWRARLKGRWRRLCKVHGDFHPGNIWFAEDGRMCLLDRSRGPWGEAADDVTALTINYIFYSVRHFGEMREPYLGAFRMFFEEYLGLTGDEEIREVLAPFYAFRGAVVANPSFYPELGKVERELIFNFVRNVLDSWRFHPDRVREYVAS